MTAGDLAARSLFRAAYENRYTWDRFFPGFTADVGLERLGQSFVGRVKIPPNFKSELSGIEDREALSYLKQQLWEISVHRLRRDFEELHCNNTFFFGTKFEDGTQEIVAGQEDNSDRYHLKDNIVTLVYRHLPHEVITVNTLSVHNTTEGYIAHCYSSVYRNSDTGQEYKPPQTITDEYALVGKYHILTSRRVENEKGTTILTLNNIQLLEN